jgi:RNA polymerase sigma-70 factor (ECF subfamily)
MDASWSGEVGSDSSAMSGDSLAAGTPPPSGVHLISSTVPSTPSIDFAELYRTHFSYVWRSARRLGVAPSDLDDVVQETFLTVHRLLDSYQARGSEQAWLFALLYRVVQRHRRSHARRNGRTDEAVEVDALPGSTVRSPDKSAETGEDVRLLEELLDKLDPDQRAVLILVELEEKGMSEVAEILGVNANTAASRLRLAREHVEAGMARHRARDGWRLK